MTSQPSSSEPIPPKVLPSLRQKWPEAIPAGIDQAMLMQLMEATHQTVCLWIPDFSKLAYVSPTYEQVWGHSRENLYQNPQLWIESIHSEDRDRIHTLYHQSTTPFAFREDYRIVRPDGTMRWISTRCFPFHQETGEVTCIIGLVEDITARKATEEALKLSEKRYQRLAQDLERRVEERTWALNLECRKSQLLSEVSAKIRQSIDLGATLQTTMKEVQRILRTDRVLVYQLFPNGTGQIISEAVSPGYPQILGRTLAAEVFPPDYRALYGQGRVRAIPDVTDPEAKLSPCLISAVQEWGVKAKLIAPILSSIEPHPQPERCLWGLLVAHQCDHPRHWTDFEIDLMQQLATQISISIQQSLLFNQVQVELAQRIRMEVALKEARDILDIEVEVCRADLTVIQQRLQRQEGLFHQIAQHLREVCFVYTADLSHLLYVSPSYEQMWQLPRQALYANPHDWLKRVHPEDRDRAFNNALREMGSPTYHQKYRLLRPDGELYWIQCRSHLIYDSTEAITHVIRIAERVPEIAEDASAGHSIPDSSVQNCIQTLGMLDLLTGEHLYQVGQDLAYRIQATNIEEFLDNYGRRGLGRLRLESAQTRQWIFAGENLAEFRPHEQPPMCPCTRGFLSGMIQKLNPSCQQVDVIEMADPPTAMSPTKTCRFVAQAAQNLTSL